MKMVAPALLVAVASTQIALSRTVDLTAWKGGGFGMFATLDHAGHRGVDILVEAPDRSEALQVPASIEEAAARAAACPADWTLRTVAEAVVARERRYHRAVSRVTLTFWRADFDRATLRPSERPVRTFVYDVP